MPARTKKPKKSGGGIVLNTVSAIIICVALVLGVSVFFRVSIIEVAGASRYSASEIIEASGINEGENLVFLNRASAEGQILDSLVYVARATVRRSLPNKVVIEIHESGTVAYAETESGYWLIDNYCRLLEECPAAELGNHIEVVGFTALEPKAGKKISVPEEDKSKVEYLSYLLTALGDADMLRDVKSIDMSTSGNPQFEYLGRFRVKLGRSDNIEAKLALLASAIEKLEPHQNGVFDLSKDKEAYFSPEKEQE